MFGDWDFSARTRRVVATLCLTILTILTGLTALAGRAEAGLTMTADAKGGVEHLISVQARYDGMESAPVTYLAGTFTASLNGGPAFNAYCVDLYHVDYVGGGGSTYVVNPLPIAQLGPPGGNGAGVGFLYQTLASVVSTDIQAAALQIAIWKVEYDNGGSLNNGHFTLHDSSPTSDQHLVYVQATAYLALYNGTQTGQATLLQATSHPYNGTYYLNQDLVGPASESIASVSSPEPNTIAAATLGASLAIGLSYRRRIRRRGVGDPGEGPATSRN
jgi:hypothetical protein